MKYESLVYDLIKELIRWGIWVPDAKVYCDGKVLEPCKKENKGNKFKDLDTVLVTEDKNENPCFLHDVPDEWEFYIVGNYHIDNLFWLGMFDVNLQEVSKELKEKLLKDRPQILEKIEKSIKEEYTEDYYELWLEDSEDAPNEIDFDSYEEYKSFYDEYLYDKEKEFKKMIDEDRAWMIDNYSDPVPVDNDLEVKICELVMNYGLTYTYKAGCLFIGKDYW